MSRAARTVFIEESRTPIYRRIAHAIGAELLQRGMQVFAVNPHAMDSSTFLAFLSQQNADAIFVSNASSHLIQSRAAGSAEYAFEKFAGRLIFVHQDAILGGLKVLDGLNKLQAWQRVNQRAVHLCIEADNIADLATAGIRAALVPHASEIQAAEPCVDQFDYDASFVGHVVPSSYAPPLSDVPRYQSAIEHMLAARRVNFAMPLEPNVKACVDQALSGLGHESDRPLLRLAMAQWLRNEVTKQTMPLRGWVFEACGLDRIDIFGGDPAYLHNVARSLQIERDGVHHHPAVYDQEAVQQIFNRSRVSINISSLQFDHAVVNRFHDVIMSGGLCLTDARDGLSQLTPLHAEVSYRTLAELKEKADYFARPEKARERALLIQALQRDVARNSGYGLLADAIVQAIDTLS